MRRRIFAAIGVASLGWGLAGVAVRSALDAGVEPVTMVTLRAAIAGLAVMLHLRFTGRTLGGEPAQWRLGAAMGVFNMVAPFVLFTLAYQHASAGFVGLLAALMPLATAVWAHYLVPGELLTVAKTAAMLIALAGVGFLVLAGDSGLDAAGDPLAAIALGLAAVVSIGFASAFAKRNAEAFAPLPITGIQFVVGTALLIPMMLAVDGLPTGITATGWALVVFLALVSSFLPFLLFYWVLQHASVTTASLNGYLVPLVSLVSGIVILDERLQAGIVIGGALILAGVVLTDRAERRITPLPEAAPTHRRG